VIHVSVALSLSYNRAVRVKLLCLIVAPYICVVFVDVAFCSLLCPRGTKFKRWLYAMPMSICLSVCVFVCLFVRYLKRVHKNAIFSKTKNQGAVVSTDDQ